MHRFRNDLRISSIPRQSCPPALKAGWPIATGIIEGACRHIIADRLSIGGARWGLDGAEAVLTLRAVISNGDFEEYWRFHLTREHQRLYPAPSRDNTHSAPERLPHSKGATPKSKGVSTNDQSPDRNA